MRAKVLLIRSQLKCLIGISSSMESYNMHYNTSETDREVSASQILTIESYFFRAACESLLTLIRLRPETKHAILAKNLKDYSSKGEPA